MDKHCNHTEELYKRQELEALYLVLFLTLASTMVGNKANIADHVIARYALPTHYFHKDRH